MISTERITDKVELFLKNHEIPVGSRILVAWSGGPDSTALLHILAGLKNYNFRITAAWYNHRLRSDERMKAEEELVDLQAEKYGFSLIKGSAEKGAITENASFSSLSIEESARNARYSFLRSTAASSGCGYIATGHNLNDNTETMLMRFLRNEGLQGLSGIPEQRSEIIRPMCTVTRDEIDDYLAQSPFEVSIDHTNFEKNYLRNRLRHDLLPVIREIFPEVDANLRNLSSKITLVNDYIGKEAEKNMSWLIDGEAAKIPAGRFYSRHTILRITAVFDVLNRMNFVGRIRYNAVRQAVEGFFPGNGKTLLKTSDFEIKTSDDHIFIQRLVNRNKKSYFIYLEPGECISVCGQIFSAAEETMDSGQCRSECVELKATSRLTLRSYREGDSILTTYGKKSIKKLFNEWKVNSMDRHRLPVIEIEGRTAAVAGRHLGYNNLIGLRGKAGSSDRKILLRINSDTENTCE